MQTKLRLPPTPPHNKSRDLAGERKREGIWSNLAGPGMCGRLCASGIRAVYVPAGTGHSDCVCCATWCPQHPGSGLEDSGFLQVMASRI